MPKSEKDFQKWYAGVSAKMGLDPNPDDPRHFYDWRGAYRVGVKSDASGHFPSKFKLEGHPNLVIGGIDTRTGRKFVPKRNKLTERADFFRRRDAAAVDKSIAAKKAQIRKARVAALAAKPKQKPLSWWQKINPFEKLKPILGNKEEE